MRGARGTIWLMTCVRLATGGLRCASRSGLLDCFACARNDDSPLSPAFTGRHHPRMRVIQYSTAVHDHSRGRGILDTPHARGMTTSLVVGNLPGQAYTGFGRPRLAKIFSESARALS